MFKKLSHIKANNIKIPSSKTNAPLSRNSGFHPHQPKKIIFSSARPFSHLKASPLQTPRVSQPFNNAFSPNRLSLLNPPQHNLTSAFTMRHNTNHQLISHLRRPIASSLVTTLTTPVRFTLPPTVAPFHSSLLSNTQLPTNQVGKFTRLAHPFLHFRPIPTRSIGTGSRLLEDFENQSSRPFTQTLLSISPAYSFYQTTQLKQDENGWGLGVLFAAAAGLVLDRTKEDEELQFEPDPKLDKWDVIEWFQNYYHHPDPDMFVEGINKLLPPDLMLFLTQVSNQPDDEYITDSITVEAIERTLFCMRVVGFMSELFHSNPEKVLGWYKELQSKRGAPPIQYEDQNEQARLLFSQFLWFALDNARVEQADDVLDQVVNNMVPGAGIAEKRIARANMRHWLDQQLSEPANRMAICRGKYYASGRVQLIESGLKNASEYLNEVVELESERLTEVAAKMILRDLTGFASDKRGADFMKANLHFGDSDPMLRKLMIKSIYQGGTLF